MQKFSLSGLCFTYDRKNEAIAKYRSENRSRNFDKFIKGVNILFRNSTLTRDEDEN